jgi:hypothetical protein
VSVSAAVPLRALHALGLCIALSACSTYRGPNYAWVAGGQVAPISAPVAGVTHTQTVGGVAGFVEVAPAENDFTGRGRADLAIGGNPNGAAGRASVLLETGPTLFGGYHHLFGRAGIAGTIERDPAAGLFALELPTLTVGYQLHGQGTEKYYESMHFDIGARVGLDLASRAFEGSRTDDAVAKPEAGAMMLLMGEFVTSELTYMHVGKHAAEDIVRGTACVAALVALCIETRHVFASFGGPTMPRSGTGYVGVTFGLGRSSGVAKDGIAGRLP